MGFVNIHSAGKYQKIEGGPFGDFFSKKSHRAENTLREYPLAQLSFLDEKNTSHAFEKVKVLRKQEFMTHENCKKNGPFRVRLSAEKTTHCNRRAFCLREKAPTKKQAV